MTGDRLRRLVPMAVVLACIAAVGWTTARPGMPAGQRAQLLKQFGFQVLPANSEPADARYERPVEPSLSGIQQWISAVGAAVALTDLRGLGRPADMCLVDPRDDSVTIKAVPGSDSPSYPPFKLVPTGLAYDATMAPMGCVPADVNSDGATDLIVYYWGRSPVLFLNHAHRPQVPRASDFTAAELVNPMQIWNTTALNIGDLDGSGNLSIIVGNYFPDGARVLDPLATRDSLMHMQDGMGMARNAGANRILKLHPTGVFGAVPGVTDESTAMPASAIYSWTLAIGLQDLTDTLLPSIYFANDFGPDQLLINCSTPGHLCLHEVLGNRTLTQPKSKVLGRDSFKGMGVTFSYPSGTGLPMIMVSNITSEWALFESNFAFVPTGDAAGVRAGKVPWRDDSEVLGLSRSGWSWDVKAGDFDNSGTDQFIQAEGFVKGSRDKWPQLQELAMANPELLPYPIAWPRVRSGDELSGEDQNRFYARSGGRYTNLSSQLGLDQPGVSRGFALGDVNGDGKLDAVVANQWADSSVLINTASTGHPGADLDIMQQLPSGTLVTAIGVTVTAAASDGLPAQKSQLYYANGHAGVSAAEIHLAVANLGLTTIQLAWRDGAVIHHATAEIGPGHQQIQLLQNGGVTVS
ncbi:MAG TPA: VCBS repeat-containing protein [Jatrophihabitans sp.]|nr:VCBS repeat-containing protein [Jatrophihabitans sp.]